MDIISYAYSPTKENIKQRIINPNKPTFIYKGKRILKKEL